MPFFFFSSRRRHTRLQGDWSSDVCSSDLPPLLVSGTEVEVASVRGTRRVQLAEFLVGPKRNDLEPDELIVAAHVRPAGGKQTFMKVGPRNAMVISVVSLARSEERRVGKECRS